MKCPECGSAHVTFTGKWEDGDNPYGYIKCHNCGETTIIDDDDED